MTRKNRRDVASEVHDMVWADPSGFTRASRRAAGHHGGVHLDAMRAFNKGNRVLPRAIRRLFRDPDKAQRRVERNRPKVQRLLAPCGVMA